MQNQDQSAYLYREFPSFATKAIHFAQHPDPEHGSVNVPIHFSTNWTNPTRKALEECLAELECNKYCITYSSGLGAMMAVLSLLQTGDRLICSHVAYGGVLNYVRAFTKERHGIDLVFVDMTNVNNVVEHLTPNTKMIWAESPSNPVVGLTDIEALAKLCKDKLLVVDTTFATPYLQTPSQLGAQITMNSGTKYLGGHSDLMFGLVTCSDKDLYDRLHFASETAGFNPSTFDCYLMLRSIKTLAIRVKQHCHNAYYLAQYLEQHPKIERVLYPGLKSHPQHELCKKQMRGSGGMLAIYIKNGTLESSTLLMQSLKYFHLAASLGGVESLICLPTLQTHEEETEERCLELGITYGLLRVSVGIENVEDLIADFEQALEKI